jgi:hypothetical protein
MKPESISNNLQKVLSDIRTNIIAEKYETEIWKVSSKTDPPAHCGTPRWVEMQKYGLTDHPHNHLRFLDEETQKAILHSSKYDEFLNQESWIRVMPDKATSDVLTQAVEEFFDGKILTIKINVQHPGQICPIHLDRPERPGDPSLNQNQNKSVIFFDDWVPGQVWLHNEQFLQWKAFEMYTDNFSIECHGTSNFSFQDRISMQVCWVN